MIISTPSFGEETLRAPIKRFALMGNKGRVEARCAGPNPQKKQSDLQRIQDSKKGNPQNSCIQLFLDS